MAGLFLCPVENFGFDYAGNTRLQSGNRVLTWLVLVGVCIE